LSQSPACRPANDTPENFEVAIAVDFSGIEKILRNAGEKTLEKINGQWQLQRYIDQRQAKQMSQRL